MNYPLDGHEPKDALKLEARRKINSFKAELMHIAKSVVMQSKAW